MARGGGENGISSFGPGFGFRIPGPVSRRVPPTRALVYVSAAVGHVVHHTSAWVEALQEFRYGTRISSPSIATFSRREWAS